MRSSHTARLRIIWIIIAAIAFLYAGRLYWLQVVDAEVYALQADRQYFTAARDSFDRGSIFFTDKDGKHIAAATLKSGFILAVDPSIFEASDSVYAALNEIVALDRQDFFIKANREDDTYEEIARRVDESAAERIRALALPGVILTREQWRYYPASEMASHLLGFVGYQEDVLSGRYGLERYYDDVLSRELSHPYVNIFVDLFSGAKDAIDRKTLRGDIVTTIEPNVQSQLEGTLSSIEKRWNPDSIGGIVINPQNGEILALAVSPDFNPNTYSSEADPAVFSNPLVESVYEMGSIIKPLTIAAGLDSGAVTAQTTYLDEGFLILNGSRFSNFDGKGRGVVNMQEVLNQSLNTGAAFVVKKMGNQKFARYMREFGLGVETGIDLPAETHGLIDNLNSPRDIEYATASFGQGIAITPIETVRALSALANGGYLITPHLVKSVRYDVGLERSVGSTERKPILKQETSEEISRMLVEVYDTALSNGKVKMKNYSIAAKTGTAQMAIPGGRGYYTDRYLHSFFGYLPAYDSQFLVFLYIVNPKGVQYAAESLTYPFVDMAKFLINYYNVPPDR